MNDALARKEANSKRLREDVAARRVVFRALPEVIALHTTEKCNLRCVMCPRSLGQGKLQLSRDRLSIACDALFPTAKKVALSAAAGEPMLADFELVLEKALAHSVRIDVVTNGSTLTPEVYRTAAPAFDHVNVSIDSHRGEVYERIRVGGRFERLHRNLVGIREERRARPDSVLLSLSAVVMNSTIDDLEGLIRYARDLEVDGLILQRLSHVVKASRTEDPFLTRGEPSVRATLAEARRDAESAGLSLFVSDFGEPNHLARPLRDKIPQLMTDHGACWYVLQHFGIQPTGEVYPCAMPTDFRLGSLIDQDVESIWNGPIAQQLRASHWSNRGNIFCSGCIHAPTLPARWPIHLVEWLRRQRIRASGLLRRFGSKTPT